MLQTQIFVAIIVIIILPFIKTTYFFLVGLIIFSVFLVMFLWSLSILLKDVLYRPRIPQYPYNIILDRIIPIILICFPTVFAFINPFESTYLTIFFIGLFTHCLLIAPLMHFWSKHRNWDISQSRVTNPNDSITLLYWNDPLFFYYLSIALVYPLIWGLYFSFSRYLRLGLSIDAYTLVNYYNPELIALCFATSPLILLCFLRILLFISALRNFIWNYTSILVYSFHIALLEYDLYFRCFEKLYKGYHFLFTGIIFGTLFITSNPKVQPLSIFSFLLGNICYISYTYI